jgi:Tfp pilus assembly protein PilV
VTLIELMIVLVIIAIGILPIAAVQTNSGRDVVATGQHTRALAIAQGQMEVARAAGFTAVQPDSGQVDGFNWKTEVATVSPGLVRVDVTVAWTEQGAPQSLQLNSLLSRR